MSWIYLTLAIIFEVCGTLSAKLANGFTERAPSILMFLFYGLSLVSLTIALKRIDVSIAYAIWSGAGTAVIAVIGIVYLHEPATAFKMVCLSLIIAGVVGLNFTRGGII
jgi:small multidrug resistance pump